MQGGGQMVSISHRNIRGGQQHSWWVAISAVGSNICGGQQHPRWVATSAVGSNICGGQQHPRCGQQHLWWAETFVVGSNNGTKEYYIVVLYPACSLCVLLRNFWKSL